MITRVLPIEEWPRLKGTEAERLWPMLDPTRSQVLVVEDAGRILGCWVLMWQMHAECVWVAEDQRKGTAVQRRLWEAMQEQAEKAQAGAVITGAISDDVRSLLEKHGAKKIPGDAYAIPIGKHYARCQKIGKKFHDQLEAQLGHEAHPDDPVHNAAVGNALLIAVKGGQPERAEAIYNAWATLAGYDTLKYLGTDPDGSLRVNIQSATIAIDSRYRVRLLQEAA